MAQISFTNFANVINKYIAKDIKIQVYSGAPTWLLYGGWNGLTTDMGDMFNSRTLVEEIGWFNNMMYFDVQDGVLSAYSIPTGDNLQNSVLNFPQGSLPLTTSTSSFNIPKQLMNLTRGAGAIAGTLEKYSSNLSTGMAVDLNRQSVMDGTGNLAFYGISSSNSATPGTYTAITNSGNQYFVIKASPNGDYDVSRYMPAGTQIMLINGTYSTSTYSWTITTSTTLTVTSAINANGLVTVTCGAGSASTFTPTATTAVVKVSGSGNPVVELVGLLASVGNGTYGTISPATSSSWQATVNNNGGTNTTLKLNDVNLVYNTVSAKGFGRPDIILSNVTEYTAAQNLMYTQLRFKTHDTFYGGGGGMEWGGGSATWFLESDMPDDRIVMKVSKDLFKGQYQALEVEPGSKGNALRVPGTLNYEVVADWMGQIGDSRRSSGGILANRVG